MKELEFKGYRISETQMLIEQIGDIPIHILVNVEDACFHNWIDYILACLNRGNEFFVTPSLIGSPNYHVYANATDLTKEGANDK